MKQWGQTMIRRLNTTVLAVCVLGGAVLSQGCMDDSGIDDSTGQLSSAVTRSVVRGRFLFNHATFGGNGRTCATCHPSTGPHATGTLNPEQVQALYRRNPNNALFRHDGADTMDGDTFERIQRDATILIDEALPPNVSIAGSDSRHVIMARGIPTTMNTPALDPVLMYDGRAPDLQAQALGALFDHSETTDVTDEQLDAIADFQQTLFLDDNLRENFEEGEPITMPYGRTESEKRGRRFFIADDTDDPDMVGEGGGPPLQLCGGCHSGPMLNHTSHLLGTAVVPGLPAGTRFFDILVSEVNEAGNPAQDYVFQNPDGTTTTITSPDIGRALVTGNPADANAFKIPPLWGATETAPYFHDNSAKDLQQLLDHYNILFLAIGGGAPGSFMTPQDEQDIIAYMKLLGPRPHRGHGHGHHGH